MTPIRKKILVLDDSDICLEIARDALEGAGYEVVTTDSAIGISRLVQQTRPDAVVVDVNMPALSGDSVVELLRKSRRHEYPILLHSDRPVPELAELTRRSGADGFAEKTPDDRKLVDVLQRLLP